MTEDDVPNARLEEGARAIQAVREEVRWKHGKDVQHLTKRQALGHLPEAATFDDYNGLIAYLASQPHHRVYLYLFGEDRYYGVRGSWHETEWLALFGSDGIMETAFPPADMDGYLQARGFTELGTVQKVMAWNDETG